MRIHAAGLAAAALITMGAAAPGPTHAPAHASAAPTATPAPDTAQWLARFQTAWDGVKTYKTTVNAHESLNGKTQDRKYIIWFQKPNDVRLDITAGDGKGSVAVWHGADSVRGHQGGFLRFITLNISIHDGRAVSLRGTTIAQASFGAYLEHMKTTKWKSTDVTIDGDKWTLTAVPENPAQDDNVVKEVMTLGANALPVELTQYDASGTIAKHVTYADVDLNVDIPASVWQV